MAVLSGIAVADDHGNSTSRATRVNVNSTTSGRIERARDYDYFRIDIPSSGTLTVNSTGSLDTFGYLLDSNGRTLTSNDDSGSGTNFRISRAVTRGTVYVKVRAYSSRRTGSYRLVSSFTPSGGSSSGGSSSGGSSSRDDHGNSTSSATRVNTSSTTSGRIERARDYDYFRIDIPSSGTLTVNSTGSFDTYGHLLDSSGREMARDDDGGSGTNFRISRAVTRGTVYIKVRAYSRSRTGSYRFVSSFRGNSVENTSDNPTTQDNNILPINQDRLIATSWNQDGLNSNQYPLSRLNINERTISFIPGCTSVAVSQLINYYLTHGYSDGWLDNILQGNNQIAYPRFTVLGNNRIIRQINNLNYRTLNSYTNANHHNRREFLFAIAIALDANFVSGENLSTGVRSYNEEYYTWVRDPDTKIQTLLRDRLRFRNSITISRIERFEEERNYIQNSLNNGRPVLISLYGIDNREGDNESMGHTAIIDQYRIHNGVFQIRINMGWGGTSNNNWYNGNFERIFPVSGLDFHFDNFTIYKNVVPINYRNTL